VRRARSSATGGWSARSTISGARRSPPGSRGQIAAIHVKDKIFHAALILGLARIGVVTLSARSHAFPPEIGVDAVIADANATYQNARRVIVAEPGVWMDDGDGAPLDPSLTAAGGHHLCRITLTSGSTGVGSFSGSKLMGHGSI
jgi:hypothetical protein